MIPLTMKDIKVSVDPDNYLETRRLLYQRGMSFQEFINGVLSLSVINDHKLTEVIDLVKQRREISKKTVKLGKHELFNKLKTISPLNNYYQEPEEETNDNSTA